ncbi:MBL fold metallo-hydrolase [Rhodopirellula halodulae]|uniref:MBL fold metallo-hydrolase n=1 Tax=Rhodopirellula halodulae TaxID=2894198 RepID=UPI001E546AED|nr:MBL fold metallo-hydrolase [Rhodopirellula sp. JC737]MCC9656987.1 MBL fold metallo-hydrolase [Rhodopirellula sp. JC737]
MDVLCLQSGSSGNCVFVDTGTECLLFDAGISYRKVQTRLNEAGRDASEIDAIIISHDHRDHIGCLGVLNRKLNVPIHISRRTLASTERRVKLGPVQCVQHFSPGETISLGETQIETIPTPHDGVDGSAFTIDNGCSRFGLWTDLGCVFDDLLASVKTLDALLIESNYDETMLAESPYPDFLRDRISGPGGHISNREAAEVISHASEHLQWACLAHLSDENNDPAVAMQTHRKCLGNKLHLVCAHRQLATDPLRIQPSKNIRLTQTMFF